MKFGRRAQLLLIIAVGLAVYYPAILAELSDLDDFDMIAAYRSAVSWNLKGLFLPGGSGGGYYRPLIGLSFLVDRFLFQQNVILLHLHNVALHLFNAVLVYYLALSLLRFKKVEMKWLPLTAALSFCLHPITTESVAWISGRTDVLASSFVLSSSIMLIRFRMLQQKRYFMLSLGLFLLATLTKEVALAFLPGMVLMLVAREGGHDPAAGKWRARPFFLAGLATTLLFFLFRSLAFTSNTSRIGLTLLSIKNSPYYAAMTMLGAFGFYMKKAVLPLPLNFAIVEVDPLYQLLALPLVGLCAYLLCRRSMAAALYLSGMFLLAPSFLIAMHQVAWTPYAERYLYLPTAFMVVPVLYYLGERLPAARPQFARGMVLLVLPLMAAATFARNQTWQTNFSLVQDTVQKSPYFPEIRLLYASLLQQRGDLDEALVQARLANSASKVGYDERPELCVAEILQTQGKTDEALLVANQVLKKQKGHSRAALLQLAALWKDKVRSSVDTTSRAAGNKSLLENYRLLYAETKDPGHLYSMGLVSVALQQTDAARGFFRRTIEVAPVGSTLKQQAGKEIASLEGQ